MKTPKGFFTYFHHEAVLDALSDEQAGRLYKALLHYGNTGELPEFAESGLNVAFTLFRTEIDYNFDRYREICEARSAAGKKSAESKKQNKNRKNESDSSEPHRLKTITAQELMQMRFSENER